MRFVKMQGIGNDYVYVDCFQENVKDPEELSKKVSDRHMGIGSDGLILIMPSDRCDFRMRMFNADGSEAQMCGNGSRCVGKYVYDYGLTDKTSLTLETKAGLKKLELHLGEDGKVDYVRVDIGEPILQPEKIPVNLSGDKVINRPTTFGDKKYNITCVSMGNPHAVIFTKNVKDICIEEGRAIEYSDLFPERTNVEFVEILNKNHAFMRVWERGSGETLACGTGACATLVAGVLNGFLERKAVITLLGGDLEIEWKEEDNHIYMKGPAVTVFEGNYLG